MRKRALKLLSGVDNMELFYDLIFVYCISVITSMVQPQPGGFIDIRSFGSYLLAFLTVLQIWFYTTLLINRFGERSVSDYACLIVNMFLLYFMASSFAGTAADALFTADLSWALVLVNLIVHWVMKRFRYNNIDDIDRVIINRTVVVLAVQCALIFAATFTKGAVSSAFSLVGLAVGFVMWAQGRFYRLKPLRFEHISERCALLVIVTFGETVVAVAAYMQAGAGLPYAMLVFAMVVGMFLVYNFEYENLLDHHAQSDGMAYMTVHLWLVLIISNVTVALEFLPDSDIEPLFKSIYLTLGLVLFLLVSFMLNRFNKPPFRTSVPYIAGRLIACGTIIVVGFLTQFDTRIMLLVDVVVIYAALAHEGYLFRTRTWLMAKMDENGIDGDSVMKAGADAAAHVGVRELRRRFYKAFWIDTKQQGAQQPEHDTDAK